MKFKKYNSYNLLKHYFQPYKKLIWQTIIALLFTSVLILTFGKAIGYLVNNGFDNAKIAILNRSFLYIILIIAGIAIASYFRCKTLNSLCEKAINNIRLDIYKKLINQPISYYETNKVSGILTNLINDATIIIEILSTTIPFAFRYLLTAIGGIIFLFCTNLKLTLYVFITAPITIIPILLLIKYIKKYSSLSQNSISDITSHLDITLNNTKTIQLYQKEDYEIAKFKNFLEKHLTNSLTRIKYKSILISSVIFLIFTSISYIMWIGVNEVISGNIQAGELSSFIYYAIIVASGIAGLSDVSSDLIRLSSSLNNLNKILLIKDTEPSKNAQKLEEIDYISFENVSFNYPSRPNSVILNNVSFEINKGDKIAIIGPSGIGKTTIFQLLLKLYDSYQGSIEINNIDLKNIDTNSLRGKISLVTQESVIFSENLYENIKYGNDNASTKEIEKAAKDAGIVESSLQNGLYTLVGEKGISLSGGEKQRIALARAFLRNSEVLLLDEPTNNLDKNIENQIQQSFMELADSKTSIIVTHNPSILKWVNKIIIINDHKVEAVGNYDQLVEISPYFRKFVEDKDTTDSCKSEQELKINSLFFN